MAIAARARRVRPMTMDDVSQVMEIERQSFPDRWPQTLYKRELEQNSMARYLVLEQVSDDRLAEETARGSWLSQMRRKLAGEPEPAGEGAALVVGFVGVWFMVGEAHIVTIAVDPRYRRQGMGELLLLSAIDLALAHDQEVVSLECRVSNAPAQALYEKYGFHRTGLRPRYYSDNGEDALIMTAETLTTPKYQARLAESRLRYEERWGSHERSPDALR